MDNQSRQSLGNGFDEVGHGYAAHRPGYPVDVAAWLVGDNPSDVLDLAAGSGQLTTQLATIGHRVVAAELSGSMLAELRQDLPVLAVVQSHAEQLPIRSGAFDVVTVATAFHWFDASRALPEIARVLRPGGRLGLVWNTRETNSDWARALDKLLRSAQPAGLTGDWGTDSVKQVFESPLFDEPEYVEFHHTQALSHDGLVGLVASRSYVIAMPANQRDRLLGQVSDLYDETTGSSYPFELAYRSQCWRTTCAGPKGKLRRC